MLTAAEERVLQAFRQFRITPGQMLCFHGPDLERKKIALKSLIDKDFVVKEQFKGGYSLTRAGFRAMKQCCQ